jgi:hypothetical protein
LDIGQGRAPVGLVLDKIGGVRSLLYRVTEWIAGYPLRTRGGPPEEIRELCQPWVGEPQAGSYRFAINLLNPEQLELMPTRPIRAEQITESFMTILNAVSPAGFVDSSLIDLAGLIPNDDYRQALLKLVRNVLPDGRRVKEIEFWNDNPSQNSRALLHAGTRFYIENALREAPGMKEATEVSGILRAVHLDRNWLEVVNSESGRIRCKIGTQMLDDIVGPMLNRPVLARGIWNSMMTQFTLIDIELDRTSSMSDEPPGS